MMTMGGSAARIAVVSEPVIDAQARADGEPRLVLPRQREIPFQQRHESFAIGRQGAFQLGQQVERMIRAQLETGVTELPEQVAELAEAAE